jgi:hypothetical protein
MDEGLVKILWNSPLRDLFALIGFTYNSMKFKFSLIRRKIQSTFLI